MESASSKEPPGVLSPSLTGAHPRKSGISVNEAVIVQKYLERDNSRRLLLEVGAHLGHVMAPFVASGWQVFGFEPDPAHYARLAKRFGNHPQVVLDPRAVSDQESENIPFFSSDIAPGISSFSPFHDTHRETAKVSVTTLRHYCQEQDITHIDFLLVDAEGYDLQVLRSFPWDCLKPIAVVCEFEDRKTVPLAYRYHDMADFLVAQGYQVLVSEWHPILRYGQPHDWRRLISYPCPSLPADAWGNFIAFLPPVDWPFLNEVALRETMRRPMERAPTLSRLVRKLLPAPALRVIRQLRRRWQDD